MAEDANIWVLIDDRASNINQAVGVADALDIPYTLKNIRYTNAVKLPNYLRKRSLRGIDQKHSDTLHEPWPDMVIAAGRRLAPVSQYIKKQSGGNAVLIQLMWPGAGASDFDMIAVPTHDTNHFKRNLIKTLGAPNRINTESLNQARDMWHKTLMSKAPPPPYIALLVGGDTKKGPFTEAMATELATLASHYANAKNGSLLITISRRTSDNAAKALTSSLKCPYYFHDPDNERANPYIAFLALSESIIVTGDSISMCSESCSASKPVFIYAPDALIPNKHKRLHKDLYEKGYALPFTVDNLNACNQLTPPAEPLCEAHDIARRLKEMYF